MGRITGYVGAEDSVGYTYDAAGNVLTVTDRNGTITREYDALNRITKYTDTFGKSIRYEYDAVGNLVKMIYPDDTAVLYAYDANNALSTVTDWAGRVTAYTYDANGKVTGVTKPDGSITTTVYDNRQRITSTVEKTSSGAVITGFEYTYDALGRIFVEKHLANGKKLCYTYDNLSRVTKRTVKNLSDVTLSEETFSYDAAGNLIGGTSETGFVYDTNNRLISIDGEAVSYDADGNMLSMTLDGEERSLAYDSANRLLKAGGCEYTYNAEDIRIRNLCGEDETLYTYDTNTKLSRLLVKTTNGTVTKYVYGMRLIGEETGGAFKTYHFDYRGSTVAITDSTGTVTDTFQYDTYGKQTARTGTSEVIFGYNGRDGVITDSNSLLYMRARYYSPELRRFINADIIAGEISNAITLNRYAYANGNPVSNVDPFGLTSRGSEIELPPLVSVQFEKYLDKYYAGKTTFEALVNSQTLEAFYNYMYNGIKNAARPNNIGKGIWEKQIKEELQWVENYLGKSSNLSKAIDILGYVGIVVDVGKGIYENVQNDASQQKIVSDAIVDAGFSIGGGALASAAASAAAGAVAGFVAPGIGNLIGAGVGLIVGVAFYFGTEVIEINGKSLVEWSKEGVDWLFDRFKDGIDWVVDTAKKEFDLMLEYTREGLDWVADTISDLFN